MREMYLAVILQSKVESETNDTFGLCPGGDLQGLNDTGVTLVLKTRVFTLGVFTDNGKVDVVVASRETGKGLAKDDRCVNVKLLTHGDVP